VRALVLAALACIGCAPPGTPSLADRALEGPPGRVVEQRFFSPALGVDKSFLVWLPPGYDAAGTRRWPVVYYLHGLSGNERDWIELGRIDRAAAAIGLPAIVVMPDGDAGFYADAVTPADYDACLKRPFYRFSLRDARRTAACVRKADYEAYIVRDLVDQVDATFRTVADARARGIAGLSMGGFGAFSIAMRHPDRFAIAASHSGVVALLYEGPHPYRTGQARLTTDVARWGAAVGAIGPLVRGIFGPTVENWRRHDPSILAEALDPERLALYLDCGTEDRYGLADEAAYLHDVLSARGVPHEYALVPGRHDFSLWSRRVYDSLDFFARQLRAAGYAPETP
jgi:S-formylglutathione hydrolase FrmB